MGNQKTLKRTVGEGTVVASAASLITKAVGLITLFIVLNKLSIYEYGLAKLALSIVPLLGFLRLPGMDTVIITDMSYEIGKGNISRAKGIFWSYFRLQAVLAVLAWAVLFFGAEFIDNFYEGQITLLIKIISFSFIFSLFRNLFTSIFSVELRFIEQSFFTIIEEISKLVLIIITFYVFGMGPAGFVGATVLSQILPLIIMSPVFVNLMKSVYGDIEEENINIFHIIKAHGKWSIATSYLNDFSKNIRLWIIRLFLNTEAVAIFSVALGFYSNTVGLIPFNQIISTVIPRHLSDSKRFIHIIKKSIKIQIFLFLILFTFANFVFPPIISLIFPQYIDSVLLFRIMSFAMFPVAFSSVFTILFFSIKNQKSFFLSNILKLLTTIILMPILVYFFGLTGASLEFLASIIIIVIERYFAIQKIFKGFEFNVKDLILFTKEDRSLLLKVINNLFVKFSKFTKI